MMNAEIFTGLGVTAFSGIGNPKSFEDLLKKANLNVVNHFAFSDHHWYKDKDIKVMRDARKNNNTDFIITTEKDAARLSERFADFLETEPVIIAGMRQEIISGEKKLNELLERVH
jgi:tetraacyldisaccharide 4'-kinase